MISIYCSGSIKKSVEDAKRLCWTDVERQSMQDNCSQSVVFLNPDDPIVDPGNSLAQFGRDMYQVWVASAVVVDARERRGLGIGVEIAAANAFGTPVIVVAPPDGNYRKPSLEYRGAVVSDYVHPHLASLAYAIVDTFEEAGKVLSQDSFAKAVTRPRPDWLQSALDAYEGVLPMDQPMVEALARLGST